MGQDHPQKFGRMRPCCRRWFTSPLSAELFLVFCLSLHACFCMVHVSAQPSQTGSSSEDCGPNSTRPKLLLNGTLSCKEGTVNTYYPGPEAGTSPLKKSVKVLVIITVIVVTVVAVTVFAFSLYCFYKRRYIGQFPSKDPEAGRVNATAEDPSKSTPSKQTDSSNYHSAGRKRVSKFWSLSSFRKGTEPSVSSVNSTSIAFSDVSTATASLRVSAVKQATRNFMDKIGEGGFGPVYFGKLPGSGMEVAVKVQAKNSNQGAREFATEVEILSRAKHPNLVLLIGYCEEKAGYMLVYEFLPGGTLEDRLYGSRSHPPLDWRTRLKIVVQAAKGLEYLHNDCVPSIIHRDVKSTNILLTKSCDAKVTDFGLSRFLEEFALQCSVKGTPSYLDPEYLESMNLTHKSDVYSFGIVLLEVVTGREPLNTTLPRHQWKLSNWVRNHLIKGKLEAIVDRALDGKFNKQSMWMVAELAMTCVEPRSVHRPTIREVVLELEAAVHEEAGCTIAP